MSFFRSGRGEPPLSSPLQVGTEAATRRLARRKRTMHKLIKNTLLACTAGLAVFVVAAPQSAAAFFNANDLIWDANATQGQVILKGKYKESPENGLIDQSLEAEVQNIPAGTLVFFSVDGFPVGSATADAFGTARLDIDILGLPDDGTGRVDGPRAETGSILMAFRGGNSISAAFVPRP